MNRLHPISELRDVEIKTHKLTRTKIQGDPILVQNAIQNVLDNAVEYTAPTQNYRHAGQSTVAQSVRDEGRGFDDTKLISYLNGLSAGKTQMALSDQPGTDHCGRHHAGGGRIPSRTQEKVCVTLSFPL